MNWIVSDKLFLDIQLIHSFMPNSPKKYWMVSNAHCLFMDFDVKKLATSKLPRRGIYLH